MASRSIVYIIYVYMYIYIHACSIVYTLPCVNSNIMYILYIGLKEGKEGEWLSVGVISQWQIIYCSRQRSEGGLLSAPTFFFLLSHLEGNSPDYL